VASAVFLLLSGASLSEGGTVTFSHKWSYEGRRYDIKVTVKNDGSQAARNVKVYCAFETKQKGKVYAQVQTDPVRLAPGATYTSTATLPVPRGRKTRVMVVVHGDNFEGRKDLSKWITAR
jgi:hypothetical protein